MRNETVGMPGRYRGQHDEPTCDFCGATASTVENGIPLCGVHAGIDTERR